MSDSSSSESSITPGVTVLTVVNVYSVAPQNQQRLVDLLEDASERVMRRRHGFVSANILASLDGTRVLNYAQWASQEDFTAMLSDPGAQEHLHDTEVVSIAEPHLYRVASVHHA
jgi:heme-degrading monooxygenase HmoA